MAEIPARPDSAPNWFQPGRLWSLWDMTNNFFFGSINHLLRELRLLITCSHKNMKIVESHGGYDDPRVYSDPTGLRAVEDCATSIQFIAEAAPKLLGWLKCSHIDNAVRNLARWPRRSKAEWAELNTRSRALRDAIVTELSEHLYYQYPRDKGQKLQSWKADWQPIVTAFPNTEREIFSATDCYALGHDTASVFHSMRVAEHGLRAIALERRIKLPKNKAVEWATWQEIIRALDEETKKIGGKKPGKARDAALAFYSGARADINGFKDEYRNLVMHVRATYDRHHSLRALTNVHDFMGRVAAKIDHRHQRIRWGKF
jgi:hypothetical protein